MYRISANRRRGVYLFCCSVWCGDNSRAAFIRGRRLLLWEVCPRHVTSIPSQLPMSTSWWEGMALTKIGRETHKTTTHNGQDSASAVRVSLWQSDTHGTRTMVKKMPSRDAYGGGWRWARGLRLSTCLPRLRTNAKCPCCTSYFAHVLICRGVYSRAVFISLSASNCAAFIRGRHLFEGGVYSWKYGRLAYFYVTVAHNTVPYDATRDIFWLLFTACFCSRNGKCTIAISSYKQQFSTSGHKTENLFTQGWHVHAHTVCIYSCTTVMTHLKGADHSLYSVTCYPPSSNYHTPVV